MVENGCRLLLCDTQADNMPARNFFERTGFSNIEVRAPSVRSREADRDTWNEVALSLDPERFSAWV